MILIKNGSNSFLGLLQKLDTILKLLPLARHRRRLIKHLLNVSSSAQFPDNLLLKLTVDKILHSELKVKRNAIHNPPYDDGPVGRHANLHVERLMQQLGRILPQMRNRNSSKSS